MMRSISGCLLLLGILAFGLALVGRVLQKADTERYGDSGMMEWMIVGAVLVVAGIIINWKVRSRRPMSDAELEQ